MEALIYLLPVLGFFAGWGLGIAGFFRAGAARREVRALRAELASLRAEGLHQAPAAAPADDHAAAQPAAVVELAVPPPEQTPPEEMPAELAVGPEPAPPTPPSTPGRSLEELLTQRWGVWLGAGALLLAAVFLIRFAVEEGWLGPPARCAIAALLGVGLILAAEWLARRSAARDAAPSLPDYAPPALAAGGVASLFGAAYGATVLYGLLPPLVGFAFMAASGVLGLVLSLRRGKLVAAVGLASAFLTPALVETEQPSLPGLFAYLLVVTAASMGVVRATAWGWLGWTATVAGALWVLAAGLAGSGLDLWAPSLFAPLASACFLLLLPGTALDTGLGRRLAHIPPTALAVSVLPLAMTVPDVAPAAGVLLLSPVAIAAAARERRLDRLPWLAAGVGLLLLLVWQVPAWTPTGETLTVEGAVQGIIPGAWVPAALTRFLVACALFACCHLLAGVALEPTRGLAWAGLAAAVPVLTLLVAYARVQGFATDALWGLAACAVAAVHVGAAARAMRVADTGRAGLHAAGATAALALGVAMVVREAWLTLAVALFLPPLALIAERTGLDALRRVALAVAGVVLVRLVLNHFVLGYDWGRWPVVNLLLLAYGVPAVSFAVAARIFLRRRDDWTVRVLEAGAALFATLLALLEIRHAVQGGTLDAPEWPFLEAALQASTLALLAWAALLLFRRTGRPPLLWAAFCLAGAALVLGLFLLVGNPWATGENAGAWPVVNALLPGFALPALLAALAAARATEAQRLPWLPPVLGGYALLAAFAWVTLEVRRAFHPLDIGDAPLDEAELWSYSGAWLILGAGLIALGIRTRRKEIRLAALGVIALTTLKVFLVDMDALVGLWRVLSFLGLGLALIGLGAVYRRFVMAAPGAAAQAGERRS